MTTHPRASAPACRPAAVAAGLELTGGDGHPPPNDWVLSAMGGGNAGAADDGDASAYNNAAAAAATLLLTVPKAGGLLRVAAATLRLALLHCIGAVQPAHVRHWWAKEALT